MTSHINDGIYTAITFIEENLTTSITVKDMAKAAGYSVYHFSRTFNKVTGHSPYDYFMRRKLSEAAMDVLENKDSFTDIAFKYQFTNYETFMRGFQRFFGVTPPSEFKEQRKVHMLQWKRRLSMEYLNHLNGHNYLRPTRVSLEDTIVGGHIINDRHFF